MARRHTTKIDRWLNSTVTPVALVSSRRSVLFLNFGFTTLTGWSADEIVGNVCEYRTDAPRGTIEDLLCCLCPPPEVLGGKLKSVPTYLPIRSGGTKAMMLDFLPLTDVNGTADSVIVLAREIEQPKASKPRSPVQELHAELAAARLQLRRRFGVKSFIGQSPATRQVLEQIQLACHSTAPVWITGERGVGKQHVARMIHYEGPRRDSAFVPLDCARLRARELRNAVLRLLETAAGPRQATMSNPGTVHFVNVDSMVRDVQLMVLQHLKQEVPSSVRLISSSIADISQAIESGDFEQDLAYMLTPISIRLPTLKVRCDEIELLAQSLLEELNHGRDQQLGGFDLDVMEQFREYQWPGNIAELKAVVEEAAQSCGSGLVGVQHLPFRFRTGVQAQQIGPATTPHIVPLDEHLTAVEREHIEYVLQQCRFNKTKAAQLLGMTRPKLYRRMESLGIDDYE
ncbi:MAG: sigma 54-interacting transcriptional regulator [Planctomycetota bacterium]|nr:sigma 54-interacting transcriptional regulator [Planctomycetota bacterium]